MEALLLTAGTAVLVFVVILALLPKSLSGKDDRTKSVLERLYQEQDYLAKQGEPVSIVKEAADNSVLGALFLSLPGSKDYYHLMLRAGFAGKEGRFLFIMIIMFAVIMLGTIAKLKLLAPLVAVIAAYFLPKMYLRRKITKRNDQFINMFPDAIDMIVRSVRSGHPLNTAIRMITENMDPPISEEFRRVVDEVAYGRPLVDALHRLGQRIDEPDLQFFIVVLSVQQESGGNLAEILSNLSNIIRKRKQLRLKIKAMTSEGRATGYVLGALPLFMLGILMVMAPDYLQPLFDTTVGNIILGTAMSLIALAAWVVKQMLNIDI